MGRSAREWGRGVYRKGRCGRSSREVGGIAWGEACREEGVTIAGVGGGGGARERGRSKAAQRRHWPPLPALRRHH